MRTTQIQSKEVPWAKCDFCEYENYDIGFTRCATCGKDCCHKCKKEVVIRDNEDSSHFIECFCKECDLEKVLKNEFDAVRIAEEQLESQKAELAEKCREYVKFSNRGYELC